MEEIVKQLAEIENKLEASKNDKKAFEELSAQQAKLAKELMALQQKIVEKEEPAQKALTLGEAFTNADSYKAFLSGNTRACRVELEDNVQLATPIKSIGVPADNRGVTGEPFDRYVMEGLLSSATTTSNLVEYVREKTWTNAAAETAEGALKPNSSIAFEVKQAPVQTIAHWIKITKQLASDATALASYISSRMFDGVAGRIEAQIINGDGTGANLEGLLKAGNYTSIEAKDTLVDTIARAIATVESAGYSPSSVLMNPMDWADIALTKDKNGQYLIGGPAVSDAKRIWGLPVTVSNSVPTGKYLVGDFKAAATFYKRSGIVVEMFEQDENNVQQNLITVRAECRGALAVEHPKALVGGSLVIG